jgi:hypothetical protein
VALELRPNCEYCDKDLPPHAVEARICTFECTFCADCVETKLYNVCPNCGGGFTPRPVRPAKGMARRTFGRQAPCFGHETKPVLQS